MRAKLINLIKLKYINIFMLSVLLASLVVPMLPQQMMGKAAPGPYFKTITITGGNVSTSNYTMVPITIHKGLGTDNATDYYLQNQGASDNFSDVTFTDLLGNELQFFPENYPPLENGGIAQPIYGHITDPVSLTNNGKTYVVWQSGIYNPQPFIAYRDDITGNWSFPIQIADDAPLINDDHGAPSIFRTNDGYLHVSYGGHSTALKHKRSLYPDDPTQWVAMSDIDSEATYPKWVETSANITYIFYRTYSTLRLGYKTSSDNGTTWSAVNYIIENNATNVNYAGNVVYDSANSTIHVAWTTANGTSGLRQHLYEAYLKLSDGHMYTESNVDMGVSVNETEANTLARIYQSTGIFECNVPVLRLDNDGYPYVMSTIQDGTGFHHEIASWNGVVWSAFSTIANTNWLFNSQNFRVNTSANITAYLITGGVTSSHPYYNRGGDLSTYTYNGTAWNFQETALTSQNSSFPLNIPSIIHDNSSEIIVAQVATEQFNFSDLQIFSYNGTGSTITPIIPKTYKVWVKLPSIPQYPNTTSIHMFYGAGGLGSPSAENTFTKYNNGSTGNFTLSVLGSATLTNYPVPKTLQSNETSISDAFAYGANLTLASSNFSMELVNVRNGIGSDGGQYFIELADASTIASTIGNSAAVVPLIRFRVTRYNNEVTTPSQVTVDYQDAGGTFHNWNGTGWQIGAVKFPVEGPINIRVSMSDTTIYASVTQNEMSVIGNSANISLSSVKAFSTGKTAIYTEQFTNGYSTNETITGMFLRPYMNQEPAYLGSYPILSTGTSSVSMNKDGVTSVNVTGIFNDLGSSPTQGWIDWRLQGAASWNSTANTTYTTTGNKTIALPNNLTPEATYEYRFAATSAGGTSYGSTLTFTLTMPSMTTGTATNVGDIATLRSSISNMGVASSAFLSYQWNYLLGATHSTPEQTISATGSYSNTITYDPNKSIEYRSVIRVGSVYTYGSYVTLSAISGNNLFKTLIPIIVALVASVIFIGIGFTYGVTIQLIAVSGISIALIYYVVSALISLLF